MVLPVNWLPNALCRSRALRNSLEALGVCEAGSPTMSCLNLLLLILVLIMVVMEGPQSSPDENILLLLCSNSLFMPIAYSCVKQYMRYQLMLISVQNNTLSTRVLLTTLLFTLFFNVM